MCNRGASVTGTSRRKEELFCCLSPVLKLPRKQGKDAFTESVLLINVGGFVYIFNFCLSYGVTYTLTQQEVRDCHTISPIGKEIQSILFLTSLDKATERKQKWLKLQDNMCQVLPFWPQTILPSKDKKLPHGKAPQKWCKKKWHGSYFKAIGIPLIHIG